MRTVVLYIAMSLDGFIATREGGVEWLEGDDPVYEGDGGYAAFVAEVDTVLMGANTYRQVVRELSPDAWPYPDMGCVVFTRDPESLRHVGPPQGGTWAECMDALHPGAVFATDADPAELTAQLRQGTGKSIWVCGGAQLANALLRHGLIDELRISIIPTLLGDGVPLFMPSEAKRRLKLLGTSTENGIVELRYRL